MHNTLNRLVIGAAGGLIAAHMLTPALPAWAQNDTLGAMVGTFQVARIIGALNLDHITASQTLLGISSALLALWPALCLPGTPLRRVAAQAEMVLGAVLGALVGWTWGVTAGPQWAHLNYVALEQRPMVAAFAGMAVGGVIVRALLHVLVMTTMHYGTARAVLPQTLLLTTLSGVAAGAHLPMVAVLPGALAWGASAVSAHPTSRRLVCGSTRTTYTACAGAGRCRVVDAQPGASSADRERLATDAANLNRERRTSI